MSSQKLVYIDTHVFAYKLIQTNYASKLLQQATDFFRDINNQKYQGIISTFTETEYLGMIKKVLSKCLGRQTTRQEEHIAMQDFTNFVNQMGIGLTDSDVLSIAGSGSPNLFSSSAAIIIASNSYCHLKEWKSIGGADALLVQLAIRSGAGIFATFDRGFKGLNNPNITPLIIPESY